MAFSQCIKECPDVAVVGGGPAGLMAAEVLSQAGVQVQLFDAMPSVGRKFLMAGKGGMNITHSEAFEVFVTRYGARQADLAPLIGAFPPDVLRSWIQAFGIETFVGSSGRVFPVDMKAAPLLRAWLQRLRHAKVGFHMRHRWLGWGALSETPGKLHYLRFMTPDGLIERPFAAVVLALGGGSWARLGSDGRWVSLLEQRGVSVAPLRPANCGFDVGWSSHFRERFAGQPVKSVRASVVDAKGIALQRQGDLVVTDSGIEGGMVYALSAALRDKIQSSGKAVLQLDLLPQWDVQRVVDEVARPRGARSLSSHLQSRLGITGVKAGLLRECLEPTVFTQPVLLGQAIKALPLRLVAPRPLDEAISSAGGVVFEAMNDRLMLERIPGVFCAGEMLDWEAPTGGYLLTACFASGRAAGQGVLDWLCETGVSEIKVCP